MSILLRACSTDCKGKAEHVCCCRGCAAPAESAAVFLAAFREWQQSQEAMLEKASARQACLLTPGHAVI